MATSTTAARGAASRPDARLPGTPARRLRRAAILVGAIAMVVSLLGSWIPSLWGDEAASVLSAQRPLPSLMAMLTHVDAVHGAYYLGLHVWIDLFGPSPFSVRFPSAVAAGLTAAAVTWLCGRFGSVRFALVAGLLVAILPRMTYAGTEARAYALDAAIAAILCVIAAEVLRRDAPSRRWWAAYAAILAVGVYAFLYLALMALVVGVALAVEPRGRRQLRRWAVASALAFTAAAPVIVLALIERKQIAFLAGRDRLTADAVFVKMWFGALPFAIVAWALIVVAIVVYVRRGRRAPLPHLEPLALAWLIVPMGVLLAASTIDAIYTPRYGTLAAPAAAVLMALGIRAIARSRWIARRRGIARDDRMRRSRRIAAVVAAVVVLAAAPVWAGQRTEWAKNESDWNDIAATIQPHARPGDAIVFDESVRPSRRPRLAMETNPAPFASVADATLETPYAERPLWYSSTYTVAEAAGLGRFTGVDRVWVVEYDTGGKVSTWGVADLEARGFHAATEFRLHSSVVTLFTR
ncbi:glycosyltransferase family 39 protein [Microbacterium sp. B2969]|uniref:Glycosyltransferase family 39 protein n=1 Tax=Microbacterium alkaliflavum TaxID=3248839 RepID=A0ABW7QAM4_9MICO